MRPVAVDGDGVHWVARVGAVHERGVVVIDGVHGVVLGQGADGGRLQSELELKGLACLQLLAQVDADARLTVALFDDHDAFVVACPAVVVLCEEAEAPFLHPDPEDGVEGERGGAVGDGDGLLASPATADGGVQEAHFIGRDGQLQAEVVQCRACREADAVVGDAVIVDFSVAGHLAQRVGGAGREGGGGWGCLEIGGGSFLTQRLAVGDQLHGCGEQLLSLREDLAREMRGAIAVGAPPEGVGALLLAALQRGEGRQHHVWLVCRLVPAAQPWVVQRQRCEFLVGREDLDSIASLGQRGIEGENEGFAVYGRPRQLLALRGDEAEHRIVLCRDAQKGQMQLDVDFATEVKGLGLQRDGFVVVRCVDTHLGHAIHAQSVAYEVIQRGGQGGIHCKGGVSFAADGGCLVEKGFRRSSAVLPHHGYLVIDFGVLRGMDAALLAKNASRGIGTFILLENSCLRRDAGG